MSPHNSASLMVARHPQIFAEVSCQHGDYVQDVAFDFYGTRVATASSDKKIKIWERDASGHWNDYPTYEWRPHRGPVRKLAWSHPCFGSLLASGSDDKCMYVWEEPSGGRGDVHHAGKTQETPWKRIYHSNDHLAAVVDVAFAPRKFGPCLSTASHDGKIRIFQGSDDQKDITADHPWNWERQEEFHAGRNRGTPITCHSWNHSLMDMAQSIVVGCGDGSVSVWSYTEAEDGRGFGWAMVCALKTYQGPVHSVSWAAANGRATHLIASCGANSEDWLPGITISRIKSRSPDAGFAVVDECPIVNSMNGHGHAAQAWKVQWDATGTVLASAGDDQVVRFWKRRHGQWECSEFVQQRNTFASVKGGGETSVDAVEPEGEGTVEPDPGGRGVVSAGPGPQGNTFASVKGGGVSLLNTVEPVSRSVKEEETDLEPGPAETTPLPPASGSGRLVRLFRALKSWMGIRGTS